jgi:hypothetical protein
MQNSSDRKNYKLNKFYLIRKNHSSKYNIFTGQAVKQVLLYKNLVEPQVRQLVDLPLINYIILDEQVKQLGSQPKQELDWI